METTTDSTVAARRDRKLLRVFPVMVTYEFPEDAPITVRLSLPASSIQQAIIKATRAAKIRPEFKARRPSSIVVVVFKE